MGTRRLVLRALVDIPVASLTTAALALTVVTVLGETPLVELDEEGPEKRPVLDQFLKPLDLALGLSSRGRGQDCAYRDGGSPEENTGQQRFTHNIHLPDATCFC